MKEDGYRMLVRGSVKAKLKSSLFCPNGEIENERCKEKATQGGQIGVAIKLLSLKLLSSDGKVKIVH